MSHGPALPAPPIQRFYDLSSLSDAGDDIVIAAAGDDLPLLAQWLGVEAVERFEAKVTLSRRGAGHYRYEAELVADLVQSCVVSLEPVRSHHALQVARVLQVPAHPVRRPEAEAEKGGVLTLAAGEAEVPEELESPRFDLAAPLLEELTLAIDPYPRAKGVEFEAPADLTPEEESPFAVLKRLKEGGG